MRVSWDSRVTNVAKLWNWPFGGFWPLIWSRYIDNSIFEVDKHVNRTFQREVSEYNEYSVDKTSYKYTFLIIILQPQMFVCYLHIIIYNILSVLTSFAEASLLNMCLWWKFTFLRLTILGTIQFCPSVRIRKPLRERELLQYFITGNWTKIHVYI